MTQLALAAGQPATDLAQGVGPAELAEEHRHELAPAREPSGMPLGVRPLDQRLKLRPGKQLEELAEHAAKSIHGCASFSVGCRSLVRLNITIAQGAHPFFT
jgi:hypothetical protein